MVFFLALILEKYVPGTQVIQLFTGINLVSGATHKTAVTYGTVHRITVSAVFLYKKRVERIVPFDSYYKKSEALERPHFVPFFQRRPLHPSSYLAISIWSHMELSS